MKQKKVIEKENTKCVLSMKKTTKILALIIGVVVIIGVFFVIILNIFAPMTFACTAKSCNPPTNEGYFEVPCNACGGEGTYYFYTGVLNFKKICPGTQIMLFQDGEYLEDRIDIGECRYALHFMM